MKILSVVGARPNFMKIAPFVHAIERHNQSSEVGRQRSDLSAVNERPISSGLRSHPSAPPLIDHILVHTGQHYDDRMSKSFFEDLNIPRPDIDLEIGSGSHAEQVGKTMIAFEKVLQAHRPDWVVVVGDVNATCACSITAKKEHIKVAHIEAGLRSFDLDMPEEINRMVTDRLSDLLFTPDELASENLRQEGVAEDKIKFVGNIMIDTLEAHRAAAAKLEIPAILRENALTDSASLQVSGFSTQPFSLITLEAHPEATAKLAPTTILQTNALTDSQISTLPWQDTPTFHLQEQPTTNRNQPIFYFRGLTPIAEVVFEDGQRGIVDFSDYPARGGVFSRFADMNYFRAFKVNHELGVLTWGNDVDIAPETLYAKATGEPWPAWMHNEAATQERRVAETTEHYGYRP